MKKVEEFFLKMLIRNAVKAGKQAMGTARKAKKYGTPHQGPREKARRVRQMERGIISNYPGR